MCVCVIVAIVCVILFARVLDIVIVLVFVCVNNVTSVCVLMFVSVSVYALMLPSLPSIE